MIERRAFLTGLAGLVAAPALVRAESLMRIRPTPVNAWHIETGPTVAAGFPQGAEWVERQSFHLYVRSDGTIEHYTSTLWVRAPIVAALAPEEPDHA